MPTNINMGSLVLAAWTVVDTIMFVIDEHPRPILATVALFGFKQMSTTIRVDFLLMATLLVVTAIKFIKTRHPHPIRAASALIVPIYLIVCGLFPSEMSLTRFLPLGILNAFIYTHGYEQ